MCLERRFVILCIQEIAAVCCMLIQVIMATNRIETLDPALIRPGKRLQIKTVLSSRVTCISTNVCFFVHPSAIILIRSY